MMEYVLIIIFLLIEEFYAFAYLNDINYDKFNIYNIIKKTLMID